MPYQPDMLPAVETIARFAGIEISAAHRERMRARAAFHAKRPDEQFHEVHPDGEEDDALPMCVARYEALERFWESLAV